MATQDASAGSGSLTQGPGTTPSGWDYVDAILDAVPPTAIAGTLSIIGSTLLQLQMGSTLQILAVGGVTAIVGLTQFASFIRGIYKGTRASVQV